MQRSCEQINKKHEMQIQEPSLQITLNIAKPTTNSQN